MTHEQEADTPRETSWWHRVPVWAKIGAPVALVAAVGIGVAVYGADSVTEHDDAITQDDVAEDSDAQLRPPGSRASQSDAETSDAPIADQNDEQHEDEGFASFEDPRQHVNEDFEDPIDRIGAVAAFAKAQDQALGDAVDFSDYIVPDDPAALNDLGVDWWDERAEVIATTVAELATSYRPAEDFNREDAHVRINDAFVPGLQLTELTPYPALDDSWLSAAACNASVETHPTYVGLPDTEQHVAHVEVIVEYRWVDGDDGCEIVQPDHFFVYEIGMDDDAQVAKFDRRTLDPMLVERPSGWDM